MELDEQESDNKVETEDESIDVHLHRVIVMKEVEAADDCRILRSQDTQNNGQKKQQTHAEQSNDAQLSVLVAKRPVDQIAAGQRTSYEMNVHRSIAHHAHHDLDYEGLLVQRPTMIRSLASFEY
jgi:hypothetical protein